MIISYDMLQRVMVFKGGENNLSCPCLTLVFLLPLRTPQQHQTDSIVVYSTYIEPSTVFPEKYATEYQAKSNNDTPLPPSTPSYFGEYDTDRQLHIPPRTAITVPVSIIPHWRKPPDLEFDQYHRNRKYRNLDATGDPGSTGGSSQSSLNNNVGHTNDNDDDDNISFISTLGSSSGGGGGGDTNNSTMNVLRADLLDMITSSFDDGELGSISADRRAELLDSATVRETLVANTSYGIVQMEMPYVCSPDTEEYKFGMPNNLIFVDSGAGWYARRNTTPTVELAYMFGTWEFNPTRDNYDPFIYRVYMNNPTDEKLRIYEVYTTKPHLVDAEIQIHFGKSAREPLTGLSMLNEDYLFQDGLPFHQPKKNNIYITALRLHPTNFTRDMTMSVQDLGFLIIKTNLGSFSIALDYIPDTRRGWEEFARHERGKYNSTFIHWAGSNLTSLGDGHLVEDSIMDGLLSSLAGDLNQTLPLRTMAITKSYRAQGSQSKDDALKGQNILDKPKNLDAVAEQLAQQLNSSLSLIQATPPIINFGSITTGSRNIRIPIQLKNYHSKSLRVMRISVSMSLISDNGNGNVTDISNENSSMEIGVDFQDGAAPTLLNIKIPPLNSTPSIATNSISYLFSQEIVLPPIDPNEFGFLYPLYVWCRFNTNASSNEEMEARFYTGSILIHATESGIDVPYLEWERQLLLDHSTTASSTEISKQYLLQIPFSGSVLPGNLESRTESLLFPTFFYVLPTEERAKIMKDQHTTAGGNNDVPTYYDRTLDITNNFDVDITITGMKIVDVDQHVEPGYEDFCSKRFTFDSTPPVPLTAHSGKKWKGLFIRYHFMNEQDDLFAGLLGEGTIKKCILSLDTDRAGRQSFPLLVYSGEVLVDIERTGDPMWSGSGVEENPLPLLSDTNQCSITSVGGSVVLSHRRMSCIKSWLKHTKEGAVLGKAVEEWHSSLISQEKLHSGLWKPSRKCVNAVIGSRSGSSESNAPIDYYFRSLLSNRKAGSDKSMHPIVLSFGAIHTGETTSRSILLTNKNHAPVDIMATSAALGNMNVTIGIELSYTTDLFYKVLAGSDEQKDIGYFLNRSKLAEDFFSKFRYKFDISPSPRVAQGSELRTLFKRKYVAETFENATEYLLTNYIGQKERDMDCTQGFMLSTDGNVTEMIHKRKVHGSGRKQKQKKWTIPPGGVARFKVTIQAPDRVDLMDDITPFVGTGLVLESNFGQALPIVVTYTAIAGQLELTPFDYDVSDPALAQQEERMVWRRQRRVLSSLEPKWATFIQEQQNTTVVQVPFAITSNLTSYISDLPSGHERGVNVAIRSTFKEDMYLSEVTSCNKWFNVFLPVNNQETRDFFRKHEVFRTHAGVNATQHLPIRGLVNQREYAVELEKDCLTYSTTVDDFIQMVPLGKVLSAMSCNHPSGDRSFYACALAWLENRDKIQPPGCGIDELETYANEWDWDKLVGRIAIKLLESMIQHTKANAVGALRDVVAFLSVRYPVSEGDTTESAHGYVHHSRVEMFDHARKMWDEVMKLGLNVITGHIRAKTVYTKKEGQVQTPPLIIPTSPVLLQSKLNIPKLFWGGGTEDNIIDFKTVHVAETATQYIQVVNPTAMDVRVRLTAPDSSDGINGDDGNKYVYIQNTIPGGADHPWWNGGSFWMADDNGHLISATHNVTIRAGVGAYVSLLNPALHSMSAFLLGCGKRCGLRNEQETTFGDEQNYSPIGAASGDGSALLGRPYAKDSSDTDKKSSPEKALGIMDPPSFSLGRASNEIVLKPYGSAELGPIYFRPPGRGDFEGSVYIENSLTGFEKVKVHGHGGWEHLVFLDGDSEDYASDVEFRFGKSTVVFPGSHVPKFQQNGLPVIKSVRISNKGDIPVQFSRVYMASSEVAHFTHKRRHPSSLFKGTSPKGIKCSERGFVLPGCNDSSSNSWLIGSLFGWSKSIFDLFLQKLSKSVQARDETARTQPYYEGFVLKPNQTRTVYVFHYPDCTFQTSYASVIFEIKDRSKLDESRRGSWKQSFRQRQVELLVGFDMSSSEFRHCVPFSSKASSILDKKLVIQIPPLLQDVMSFGLTRVKDWNGYTYMPRRPIEITLVGFSFIFLLFALSLDLIFTAGYLENRRNSPNWKPTCRCLARADPTSSDLVSIGKEQTKHVLLARYKKDGTVLPSQTVQPDGSFNRGSVGSKSSGTHSEAIFDRLNVINASKIVTSNESNVTVGALPSGLGWRTAMRRGIGISASSKNGEAPELKYLTRTRESYLKRQKEKAAEKKKMVQFAPATPATPTPNKARGAANNGHSTFAELAKTIVPAPSHAVAHGRNVHVAPQSTTISEAPADGWEDVSSNNRPAPQSKPPVISRHTSDSSSKGSNKSNKAGKNAATTDKAKNIKSKPQQRSNVGQTDHTSNADAADTKNKQNKQRTEPKIAKKDERVNNKPEMKKDNKREESSLKTAKCIAGQKARSTKPSVDAASVTKAALASPVRKETKQQRQAKKATNGVTKSPEKPKAKQAGKQKATSNKASPRDVPKSPVQVMKKSLPSPKPSPVRPPPGLLAPPGFMGQPDLEGISTPSSPSVSKSPQRLTTHSSPMVQPMSNSIPGVKIVQSPPVSNNDLLSLIGSSDRGSSDKQLSEGSSLFQPPSEELSPRFSSESGLSVRAQPFVPPNLEPSRTTTTTTKETNNSEPKRNDVQALFGAGSNFNAEGSNFNVSNFLDGILGDDPNPNQQQAPDIRSEAVSKPIEPPSWDGIGVSLDPWGNNSSDNKPTTGKTSNPLAALRSTDSHEESPIIAGISLSSNQPSLFATTTLLSSNNVEYAQPALARMISEEKEENDDLLEPDSFYSNLLGE